MEVLCVNRELVVDFLPMGDCIRLMEETLKSVARENLKMPARGYLQVDGGNGLMAWMPSCLPNIEALGIKIITFFPDNMHHGFETHMATIMVMDSKNGSLKAVVDGTAVTALRTAGVSGAATNHLARAESKVLALVGAGIQAQTHLEAMTQVRAIEQVRVFDVDTQKRDDFATRAGNRYGLPINSVGTVRDAVIGADIVCTVTTSKEPVLEGKWISPGTHINAVGAFRPNTRELDSEAISNARLYVDSRKSASAEAGDYLIPLKEGVVGETHIRGELGELFLGRVEGRTDMNEITVFKSLGLPVEDLAAAHHVYYQAIQERRGYAINLGGEHFSLF